MTQWLIEEAAFLALDAFETQEMSRDREAEAAESLLLNRHSELVALRERMKAG